MNTRILIPVLFLLPVILHAQDAKTPPPWPVLKPAAEKSALPGTDLLKWEGDFADRIVAGANAFVLKKIEASRNSRKPTVEGLAEILGLTRDERFTDSKIEYVDTISGARAVWG